MSRRTWLHVALLVGMIGLLVASGGCGDRPQGMGGGAVVVAPRGAQVSEPAPQQDRGLWVWDARVITDEGKQAEFLAFCREKGVSLVFADMGSAFVEPEVASSKLRVTAEQVADFATALHSAGLVVQALDGDASWSRTAAHGVALARLGRVLAFNRSRTTDLEKLDGFQFDVEPHVLSGLSVGSDEWRAVMGEYLDLAAELAEAVAAEAPNFQLGFAVPFWWDEENAEASEVNWRGSTQPAVYHLLDTLAPLKSSYLAIMAYRDTADGPDGSIAHSQHELAYADRRAPRVRVFVGQETADVPGSPEKITFWQEGEEALNAAAAQIETELRAHPTFGGVAVHHYDSYRALATAPVTPAPAAQAATPASTADALSITSPRDGDEVSQITMVKGVAPAKYAGDSVKVSVYAYGDSWYPQGAGKVNDKGEWRVECYFGNAATRSGHGFTIEAKVGDETATIDVVRR